jgi:hypothetical protein
MKAHSGVRSIPNDPAGVVWRGFAQLLSGAGPGPIDLGINERDGVAESDLLSKWIGPEATPAFDG